MIDEKKKKTLSIILALLGLFLVLFYFLVDRSNYSSKKDTLQKAATKYMEETGCYPAIRTVSYGNPSPLNFQNVYPFLPDHFNFLPDLKYWVSADGEVWISKEEAPLVFVEEGYLFFEREMGFNYYFHFEEEGEYKKERTRVDKTEKDALVSKSEGKGLETAPVNYTYEGYVKQGPIVDIKSTKDSLLVYESIIEKEPSFFASLVARMRISPEPEEWYKKHGFDVYGEEIIEGEYKKREPSSILESVRILSSDNRWSRWVNVYDPLKPEACYKIIDK